MDMGWFRIVALFAAATMAFAQGGEGKLKVKASPSRAGVFIDGKYLGPAGNLARTRTYRVPAGEHELILREPRYQEYKSTIRVEPDSTLTISRTLDEKPTAKPPFGTLKVAGFEKYAPVYVNGDYMGHADEFNFGRQGLLLNPGTYDVKITSPAGATLLEHKVTIQEKSTETVRKP